MKKHCLGYLRLVTFMLFSLTAGAAVDEPVYAVVDSVQMPAWLERHGQREPLEAGKVLHNRDRILTGDDARVLVRLAEGSAVRLGEQARLDFNALGRRGGREFTAALDAVYGTFRFSPAVFSHGKSPRAVNFRIASITASTHDADLWGQVDATGDQLCLLAGRVTVLHAQAEPRLLDDALSLYRAPKDGVPEPLDTVDARTLAGLHTRTEIEVGSGYARRGGAWKVELATVDTPEAALALYDRARAAGYAARIKPRAVAGGGYRYALRVPQLPSRAEAEILSSKLAGALQLAAPRVAR